MSSWYKRLSAHQVWPFNCSSKSQDIPSCCTAGFGKEGLEPSTFSVLPQGRVSGQQRLTSENWTCLLLLHMPAEMQSSWSQLCASLTLCACGLACGSSCVLVPIIIIFTIIIAIIVIIYYYYIIDDSVMIYSYSCLYVVHLSFCHPASKYVSKQPPMQRLEVFEATPLLCRACRR